jgi:hypothetical protein
MMEKAVAPLRVCFVTLTLLTLMLPDEAVEIPGTEIIC